MKFYLSQGCSSHPRCVLQRSRNEGERKEGMWLLNVLGWCRLDSVEKSIWKEENEASAPCPLQQGHSSGNHPESGGGEACSALGNHQLGAASDTRAEPGAHVTAPRAVPAMQLQPEPRSRSAPGRCRCSCPREAPGSHTGCPDRRDPPLPSQRGRSSSALRVPAPAGDTCAWAA